MAQQYPLLPRMYGTQMQDNEELRQLYIFSVSSFFKITDIYIYIYIYIDVYI